MFVQSLRTGLIAAMFTVLLVDVASAQQEACDVCGENVVCKKVCCLKCELKEVKFICYKSEFEDICVPCPSERCGDRCVSACLCKDGADGCGQKKIFGIWQPSGAEVKTRRRLMYKTVIKKIPTYRWELITRCHECCGGCRPTTEKLPAGIPAVPACAELMDLRQAQSQLNREQTASKPEERVEAQAVAGKTVVKEAVANEAVTQDVRIARSIELPTANKSAVKNAIVKKASEAKVAATNKAANDNAVVKVAKPIVRSNTKQQGNSK